MINYINTVRHICWNKSINYSYQTNTSILTFQRTKFLIGASTLHYQNVNVFEENVSRVEPKANFIITEKLFLLLRITRKLGL